MDGPLPATPQRLKHVRVCGYRGFLKPLELRDLGDTVVVYGLNNTGKTNLLRAVQLFARLLSQPLPKLLDETQENAGGLYERLGEDRWMFAHGSDRQILLEATLEPGSLRIEFMITLEGVTARAQLTRWEEGSNDRLATASRARNILQAEQHADGADLRAAEEFENAKSRWATLRDALRVASVTHALPIAPALRETLAAQARATDVVLRKRATRMRAIFGNIVMGLPPGALEEVNVSPEYADFGWVTDVGIIPLDSLGSGAQAVFGMLASIATVDARTVLFDEPESHLNVLQQDAVLNALLEARAELGIRQLLIASHSVKFARPELDIRLLERTGDSVSVRSISPPMLQPFESRTGAGHRREDLSMLAYDNTVELPQFVRDGLAVGPGQYVYFVRSNGNFRLLSQAHMDELLKIEI